MKILALETATEACSVALWLDGEVVERFQIAPRRHAELALPWAGELLAEAGIARSQLDAIAVGRGPGAFTGVRLAIAIAQGMALALERPLLPVSTLAALAMRARAPRPPLPLAGEGRGEGHGDRQCILAAIDARMGEVYVAAYERRGEELVACGDERVLPPGEVTLPEAGNLAGRDDWQGIGTGFDAVEGALSRHLAGRLAGVAAQELPHAADVARLGAAAFARGEAVAPEHAEPAYLRNNVALTIAEQEALRPSRR